MTISRAQKRSSLAKQEKKFPIVKKKKVDKVTFFGYSFWAWLILSFGSLLWFIFTTPHPDKEFVNDQSFIDGINSIAKTFTARPSNFFNGTTFGQVKKSIGTNYVSQDILTFEICLNTITSIPLNYSAAELFPQCYDNSTIESDHNCYGSWAVAPVSAFNNAICQLFSPLPAPYSPKVSIQQVLSCLYDNHICHNGVDVAKVYEFMFEIGLVEESCFPYEGYDVPCSKICKNSTSLRPYSICTTRNEHDIMNQIYSVGPVVVLIPLFKDFFTYSSGIYEPLRESYLLTNGNSYFNHAVKVLGWGEENETPYWLIENTWGPDWGQGGYAKLSRRFFNRHISYGTIAYPTAMHDESKSNSNEEMKLEDNSSSDS